MVRVDVNATRYFLIYLAVLSLLVYLVVTRQMGLQLLLQVDERVLLELPLARNLGWVVLVFPICANRLLLQGVKRFRRDRIGAFVLCRHRSLADLVANKIFAFYLILKRLVEPQRPLREAAIATTRDLLFLHLKQVNHSLNSFLFLAFNVIQIFLMLGLLLF